MNYRISLPILALSLFLSACASGPTPVPPEPGGPGDLSYLLDADPATVTDAELLAKAREAQSHIERFHLVEGVIWQAFREKREDPDPVFYGSGGDSMIFSGFYLASCVFRYGVTAEDADLARLEDAVRGLYLLTHCTGTPGVLARCAFPADRAAEWKYPAAWEHRIAKGFVGTGPALDDPFVDGRKIGPLTYYTRGTRDQLSGLLYGLSTLWAHLDTNPAAPGAARHLRLRNVVAQITARVYHHLANYDFKIRDERGENDTDADDVDRLLMLQLLALYRRTAPFTETAEEAWRAHEAYEEAYGDLMCLGFYVADLFNRFSNVDQYYAWNLRFSRIYSVWALEDRLGRRRALAHYMRDYLYDHIKTHKNAYFSLTYNAMAEERDRLDEAVWAVRSMALRPFRGWPSPVAEGMPHEHDKPNFVERVFGLTDSYVLPPHLRSATTYWTWQREPWRAGVAEPDGLSENIGLDIVVTYWLGRFHGLIPAP